jgi:hypothetical protein
MNFKSKMKIFKWKKMTACFVAVSGSLFLFGEITFGQTTTPTVISRTPAIENSEQPIKKKTPIPRATVQAMKFEDLSMRGSNERAVKEAEDLEKKGLIKPYGTPGTDREIVKLLSPTNFKIKPGNGLAYLSWDPVPGAKQYLVYISEDSKTYKRRVYSPIKATNIIIGNLTNGKTYYFAVAAFGSGEGSKAVQEVVPIATNSGGR